MGNIAGSYLTGVINSYLGWQYSFYINGCLAILVAIVWHFVAYNTPEENPKVSQDELEHISANIIQNEDDSKVSKIPPIWAIIKSIKVWALVRGYRLQFNTTQVKIK